MEAKELRIGNWYQNHSTNPSLKYQQITFFEDAHYVAVYCHSIPLTLPILEKIVGCRNDGEYENVYYIKGLPFAICCCDTYASIRVNMEYDITTVEYVHNPVFITRVQTLNL